MALRTITPATGGLITLDEAKTQLRVIDNTDEDDLITAAILAASQTVEDTVQRRYLPQTLEWVLDQWFDPMILPVAPCGDCQNVSITSIKYVNTAGVQLTLDPSIYWVRPAGSTVKIVKRWFVIWPYLGDGAERVVIRFQINAPAAPAPAIPRSVKQAVKLLVSHWYEHRDAVVGVENRDSSAPLPMGVEWLLTGERWS